MSRLPGLSATPTRRSRRPPPAPQPRPSGCQKPTAFCPTSRRSVLQPHTCSPQRAVWLTPGALALAAGQAPWTCAQDLRSDQFRGRRGHTGTDPRFWALSPSSKRRHHSPDQSQPQFQGSSEWGEGAGCPCPGLPKALSSGSREAAEAPRGRKGGPEVTRSTFAHSRALAGMPPQKWDKI